MSAKKDISKEFDKISDDAKQVQKKRKSLTSRIFKWMCLAVGGSLLIVGGVNIGINYNFLQESADRGCRYVFEYRFQSAQLHHCGAAADCV